MIKEVASNVPGIGIMPAISLGIFFVFFVVLGLWVVMTKKEEMEKRRQIPLDDDGTAQNQTDKI